MMGTVALESRPLTFTLVGGLTALALMGTAVPISSRAEDLVTSTAIFSSDQGIAPRPVMLSVQIQESPVHVLTQPGESTDPLSAHLVKELRNATGFTWEQLSKLLGVSRRSVHLWAAGGRMAAANEEAVARLLVEVAALPSHDPAGRRVQLLAMLDRARATHASGNGDINRPASTYAGEPGAGA